MLLCPLTFNQGDAMDPAQANTVIEAYEKEWRKLDLWKVHKMPYKPSWQAIKEFKALGLLVTVAGVDKKGNLKAFYVGIKGPHIYNMDWTFCQGIMLYIAPEFRGRPMVFRKFMKAIKKQMKADNVDLYSIALPADKRFEKAHKVMEFNGFNKEDIIFFKRTD